MPSRLLREGILDSDAVCSLSFPAEVFYRRLMSVVDDFGRFDGRPSVLRGRLYPLQIDKVREADISRWIAECVTAGLIALYAVSGKQYLLFRKLGSPRNKESKWPEPPPGFEDATVAPPQLAIENGCKQLKTDVPGSGSGTSSGTEKVSGEPAPPVPPPALMYPTRGSPKEWHLTQQQIDEWLRAYPGLDVLAECRKALAWVNAKLENRKTAGGMARFLVGWLNRSTDRPAARSTPPPVTPNPHGATYDRVDPPVKPTGPIPLLSRNREATADA